MALPLVAGAVIGGLAKLGSGIMASKSASQQAAYADEARKRAVQLMSDYQVNSLEELIPILQDIDPAQLEELAPILQSAEQLSGTELEGITLDPVYADAQKKALAKMLARGEEGLTTSEEVARSEIIDAARQANQGAQDAVLQSMARRGILGSGTELAARVAGAQNAFNRASKEAADLAAAREERAFRATQSGGEMARGMESSEYGRASDVARAKDAIAEFNARQRASVQGSNVASQNQAQASNINQRNQAYLANVAQANERARQLIEARKEATRQFNARQQARASAELGQAASAEAAGAASATRIAGIGGAIGDAATSIGQGIASAKDADKQRQHELELAKVRYGGYGPESF